jgi:anti-anti-sigma factor
VAIETLELEGEVTFSNVAGLTRRLEDALARATSVVVDLTAVTFMAGAALHALCNEQERLLERDLGLTVVCHHPQLLALFRLVELEGVLEVVGTRSAARAVRARVRPSAHLAGWVARREDGLPPEAG